MGIEHTIAHHSREMDMVVGSGVADADYDRERLRMLYENSPSARAILDHFASRQRDWSETPIERIRTNVEKAGIELSRAQVIEVFRGLEQAGCGRFVTGRRGKPSRFEWRVSLVAAGRLARGEPVRQSELEPRVQVGDEEEEGGTVEHRYLLRSGLKPITLRLPIDLTVSEASRLARFIETLPLNQEP